MKKSLFLILAAVFALFLQACATTDANTITADVPDVFSKINPKVAAETYLNSGNSLYNKADYDRAIIEYDQATILDPTLVEAFNNRGYVYYIKGDKNRAISDFEMALRLDPEYTSAKNNLQACGTTTASTNTTTETITATVADVFSRINPKVAAETYLNSANSLFSKANYDRAIIEYDQATILDPTLVEAFNNRGYVYYLKGEKDKAIIDFETALKLDPEYTSAKNNLERARQ